MRQIVLAGFLVLIGGVALISANRAVSVHDLPGRGAVRDRALLPSSRDDRIYLDRNQISQARADALVGRPISSILNVPAPLHFGTYVWDERGVPQGRVWILVDLNTQLLSVFRAGQEIGTTVVVFGGDDKQTPTGLLRVLAKARQHKSSLYDAEMPFTLRLTGDGISIHASEVDSNKATHGCIGVPLAFADHLFDASSVGDEVIIIGPASSTAMSSV